MNYEKFGFFGMPVWEKRIYIFSEKAFFSGMNRENLKQICGKKCGEKKMHSSKVDWLTLSANDRHRQIELQFVFRESTH